MGESACHMRVYSQPSEVSPASEEEEPLRALTESVSFGRFASESLAWEKWSSFSHNRHIEEAEKFSKPGSVAQKKAYFEAHYKKIAAAAALLEAANTTANEINESYISSEVHNVSSTNSYNEVVSSENANGSTSFVKHHELEKVNTEKEDYMTKEDDLVESTNQVEIYNQSELFENNDKNHKIAVTQDALTPTKDVVEQESLALTIKKKQPISSSKSSTTALKSKLPHPTKLITPVLPRKGINATPSNKRVVRDFVDKKVTNPKSVHMSINQESWDSISNKRQLISSSNTSTSGIKSKLPFLAKLTNGKEINVTSTRKTVTRGSVDKNVLVSKSLHMSMDLESLDSINNKKLEISSSKPSTSLRKSKSPYLVKLVDHVQPGNEINATSTRMKVARTSVEKNINQERFDSINKKVSSSKSPTSITRSKPPLNIKNSSRDSEGKKRYIPKSLHMSIDLGSHAGETSIKTPTVAQKNGNSRSIITSNRMSTSTPLRTTILASSRKELKHLTPNSEISRGRTQIDHSLYAKPGDGKLQSPLILKRLNTCESKIRSPTICSPFSFGSEARVAKRKEFYEKLEEKKNAAEGKKDTVKIGLNKLRPSNVSRTNDVVDSKNHKTTTPICHRKVPPSHPPSPNIRWQRTTSMSQDTSYRPPPKPSAPIVGYRYVIAKNNQGLTRSVTSLPKNTTHENASPNILL